MCLVEHLDEKLWGIRVTEKAAIIRARRRRILEIRCRSSVTHLRAIQSSELHRKHGAIIAGDADDDSQSWRYKHKSQSTGLVKYSNGTFLEASHNRLPRRRVRPIILTSTLF